MTYEFEEGTLSQEQKALLRLQPLMAPNVKIIFRRTALWFWAISKAEAER
jgi:hypothetical protein